MRKETNSKLTRNKILSLLLTLCLILGMLPITAFAEGDGEPKDSDTSLFYSVMDFEPLDESLATQYWEPGTAVDKFNYE